MFVKEKAINEVAATAIAKQKFESAVPVIISEGAETDGLYSIQERRRLSAIGTVGLTHTIDALAVIGYPLI